MSVEVALGTPLAEALNLAIQGKVAELGWAALGTEGSAMSEYFLLMLANGKTESEIAAEIAGDLLQLGPDDETAPAFASWLFGQISTLSAQLGTASAQFAAVVDRAADDPMDGSFDASMDTSDAPAAGLNVPTGPKAMRDGNTGPRSGREKRMMGQINRALDRTHDSVLHRVRTQSGNERIGRGPPAGPRMGMGMGRQPRTNNPRATNIAAGLASMGGMPPGPPGMNGMGAMNPMAGAGYGQTDIYSMMEQQNHMLQQMQQQLMMQQQQQQQQAQRGGFARGKHQFDRGGRGNQFRRGGGHHQHNGHGEQSQQQQQQGSEAGQSDAASQGDVDMTAGVKREALSPEDTICRFNLRCQNKDCKFAHQSPAAPPGTTVDVKDPCGFGAACKNRKCVGRHPSPATKMAHQGEQDCKFFPNCANPHCPFRHPTMPACRNGGECKVANCKFTHIKTPCKFRPCTNRSCPFMHDEGQRGTFQDKVWTAEDEANQHVSERKFVDEGGAEDLVLPGLRCLARAQGRQGAKRNYSPACRRFVTSTSHGAAFGARPQRRAPRQYRPPSAAAAPTVTPASSLRLTTPPAYNNSSNNYNRQARRHYAVDTNTSTKPPPRDIAVLGGGLTGLSTAWHLMRLLPTAKITLYEASERLGGWIDTETAEVKAPDGTAGTIRVERAARMIKPQTGLGRVPKWDDLVFFDMVTRLNLTDQLMHSPRGEDQVAGYIYYPDHLVGLPRGFPNPLKDPLGALRAVAKLAALLAEPVFRSLVPAVLNLLSSKSDPYRAEMFNGRSDMSVGDYYAYRFGGPGVVDNVMSAMTHGITGGDVWKQSMASGFMADHLVPTEDQPITEVQVRCADHAMMRRMIKNKATFDLASQHLDSSALWFRDGFSTLPNALADALKKNPNVTIKTGDPVTGVHYDEMLTQVAITTKAHPEPVAYDKVVSTIFAKTLADITDNHLPSLAASTAVTIMLVNIWYPTPQANFPHNGFGYLLPQALAHDQNPECVLGVIFDSDREFPLPTPQNPDPPNRGADTLQGTKLTVMLGGHYWDDLPDSFLPTPESAIEMAKRAVARHLHLPPDLTARAHASAKLCRDCIPQHLVGHRARLRAAAGELQWGFKGRLAVAGQSYQNPGVLGVLRAGHDMAVQIAGLERALPAARWTVGDTGLDRFVRQPRRSKGGGAGQ
ncbi:hypothetical protein C8A00DRAFT_43958 [Chaetomidium leptoderma]|uniref:protoporphyrinogen oxidase n=1 Tax=Chaetomidium leptoderma TaxID=669021 RepID=A0AAN6VK81_9PEZI|nr:hypothetical protein C8A00DRAFT_43958 [Chaetomidium leptoderma]